MCFKLSKRQVLILIIIVLFGALIGYISQVTLTCKVGVDCQRLLINNAFSGFLIFGILTYIIEVIYNYLKRK